MNDKFQAWLAAIVYKEGAFACYSLAHVSFMKPHLVNQPLGPFPNLPHENDQHLHGDAAYRSLRSCNSRRAVVQH